MSTDSHEHDEQAAQEQRVADAFYEAIAAAIPEPVDQADRLLHPHAPADWALIDGVGVWLRGRKQWDVSFQYHETLEALIERLIHYVGHIVKDTPAFAALSPTDRVVAEKQFIATYGVLIGAWLQTQVPLVDPAWVQTPDGKQ